jgi:hypothetical protein
VIYILKNPDFPFVLIGTADGIAEMRDELRDPDAGPAKVDGVEVNCWNGLPPWMKNLQVMGMLAGDERAAAELRREFLPEAGRAGDRGKRAQPWGMVSPRFLGWLVRETIAWDGSGVEKLQVKGLGRQPRIKPAPRISKGAAARLARRQVESRN